MIIVKNHIIVKNIILSMIIFQSLNSLASESSPQLDELKQFQSELRKLSLTELLETEVTSVAKKTQKIADSAAAISVITKEDIRRSAATTLPDVLRLATGLQVTQTSGHTWAISARGFNNVYASKLLVLIDGRSIYMPDFSGVMWDMQDMILEDIERIEVIRGSGGTIWGANAVNGVINIITKHAKDTVGTLLSVGMGTTDKAFGSLRQGFVLNEHSYMRVYAKSLQQNAFQGGLDNIEKLWSQQPVKKGEPDDSWSSQRTGLRIDSDTDASTHWMLQSEASQLKGAGYRFYTREPATQQARTAHILGSLKHEFSENSDVFAQAYYDYLQRDFDIFAIENTTLDLDFHHRWQFSPQQEITWGGGYRMLIEDQTKSSIGYQYLPSLIHHKIINFFVQDEIALSPTVKLTLGNKFERDDATGWAAQPNIRLLWKVTPQHSFWSAVSRSVRTPARYEQDLNGGFFSGYRYPISENVILPQWNTVNGLKDIRSEKQLSYELGWHFQSNKQLSFDTALFSNHYDDLIGLAVANNYLDMTRFVIINPYSFKNLGKADTLGLEMNSDWQVTSHWRLHAGYTYLYQKARVLNDMTTTPELSTFFLSGLNARHQLNLRSYWNIAKNWQWDIDAHWFSRMERMPNEAESQASAVDAYLTLDTRLSWQLHKNVELSLVGRNLLSRQHLESLALLSNDYLSAEVPRSAYLQVRWEIP